MPKLTKTIVESAAPTPSRYWIWCTDLPGFGVRVETSGRKVFYFDYRDKASHERKRMKLDVFGKVTVDQARAMAKGHAGDIAMERADPLTERKTQRSSKTMAQLCDDYLAAADAGRIEGKGGRPKKSSTLATDRGRIERHIKPLLGAKKVKDLKRSDIVSFIKDVEAGKTAAVVKTGKQGKAIVEGGAGTATRTAGLLGGILSFAVEKEIIEHNPARGVKRPRDQVRQRRLTADEYAALGKALDADVGETWQAVAGVKLLALTGCRLQEIAALKWAEVDEAGGCFRLADTKEGASIRPIGKPVFVVLRDLDRPKGAAHVLPAPRKDGFYAALDTGIDRIMKRAGLEGVTAHTLRHSYASVAGDLGYSELTIKALIGHAANTVTSRYVHHLDAVLVATADKVAAEVQLQLTLAGTAPEMSAKREEI